MAHLVAPGFPDLSGPAGLRQVIGKLREDGLATFSGLGWGVANMPTSDTAEKLRDAGEQARLLARLAKELGDRTNGWSSTLAPARGRPVLEVVSLATRRSVRVVAEAGSLWWWPQVVEISPVSDVPDAATRVAAVLGGRPAADVSQSADRRAR